MQTKPSIVFCHGLWADGSCFSKLIVPLQAEGYECIAAQYGLNRTEEDVAVTKATSHIEVIDGRIWLRRDGTKYFCGDLSEEEQKLVWATQGVPKPDLFGAKAGGTAWKTKPSWYIVGKKDHTVHPDLERAMAKRMRATTYELDSSHVPMLSQPDKVLDVIRAAVKGVLEKMAA